MQNRRLVEVIWAHVGVLQMPERCGTWCWASVCLELLGGACGRQKTYVGKNLLQKASSRNSWRVEWCSTLKSSQAAGRVSTTRSRCSSGVLSAWSSSSSWVQKVGQLPSNKAVGTLLKEAGFQSKEDCAQPNVWAAGFRAGEQKEAGKGT